MPVEKKPRKAKSGMSNQQLAMQPGYQGRERPIDGLCERPNCELSLDHQKTV